MLTCPVLASWQGFRACRCPVLPAPDLGRVRQAISMDKTRFLVKLRAGGGLSGLMANVVESVVLEILFLIDVISTKLRLLAGAQKQSRPLGRELKCVCLQLKNPFLALRRAATLANTAVNRLISFLYGGRPEIGRAGVSGVFLRVSGGERCVAFTINHRIGD